MPHYLPPPGFWPISDPSKAAISAQSYIFHNISQYFAHIILIFLNHKTAQTESRQDKTKEDNKSSATKPAKIKAEPNKGKGSLSCNQDKGLTNQDKISIHCQCNKNKFQFSIKYDTFSPARSQYSFHNHFETTNLMTKYPKSPIPHIKKRIVKPVHQDKNSMHCQCSKNLYPITRTSRAYNREHSNRHSTNSRSIGKPLHSLPQHS